MIGRLQALEKKFGLPLIFCKNFSVPISNKSSQNLTSYYSNLIDRCLSLRSLVYAKLLHAQLIKIGLSGYTFLGNRYIDLYSKLSTIDDALQVFDEIPNKNCITWNLLLMVLIKFGRLERAHDFFGIMPERDVVSWNSMISGYAANRLANSALEVFREMQRVGVRPSGFTFSLVLSFVWSADHGKQIHGCVVRSGLNLSNVVIGNSLIGMYGRFTLVRYAFNVFLSMKELDIISWNSLMSGLQKSGYRDWALDQFCLMRSTGHCPDHFTMSMVITICSNLLNLEKGKQTFSLCIKMGFLSNSIVLSAIIDMFSKCNRLEDSLRVFEEVPRWDSSVCNSMISAYARHGFEDKALWLFVLTLRENLRPTEFTLSSVLSRDSSVCNSMISSCLLPTEQGTQIHSLALKMGLDSDAIVACSLMDMYSKSGSVHSALKIFPKMSTRDLVFWNSMIMGFARNGCEFEALKLFEELLESGLQPDEITFSGVLLACSNGGLVNEGMHAFLSMVEKYGIIPRDEHYACMVDMMGQAGKLAEAMDIIETMPHKPNASIWGLFLRACVIHGNLKLMEIVAERVLELKPISSLPYLVLARTYGIKGKWESVVRVRKAMKERGVKKVNGCSWIGIRNQVLDFKTNQIQHCGGEIYSILQLLLCEMADEGYILQQHNVVEDGGEQ